MLSLFRCITNITKCLDPELDNFLSRYVSIVQGEYDRHNEVVMEQGFYARNYAHIWFGKVRPEKGKYTQCTRYQTLRITEQELFKDLIKTTYMKQVDNRTFTPWTTLGDIYKEYKEGHLLNDPVVMGQRVEVVRWQPIAAAAEAPAGSSSLGGAPK